MALKISLLCVECKLANLLDCLLYLTQISSSYPIPPEGEWDLVVVWFHLRYYYYTRSSSSSSSKGWSVKVGQISIFS